MRTTGGPQNSGCPIVSISRYFSSGVVSVWLTPPYLTGPHAGRARRSTATAKRRTELRRRRPEKLPVGTATSAPAQPREPSSMVALVEKTNEEGGGGAGCR